MLDIANFHGLFTGGRGKKDWQRTQTGVALFMAGIGPNAIQEILRLSGGSLGRLRLMKMLFLVRMETGLNRVSRFYDFLPYRFGPFSFSADRDIRKLESAGVLTGSEKEVCLTIEPGRTGRTLPRQIPASVRGEIRRLVQSLEGVGDNEMINRVYARYPSYTVLSERKGKHPPRPTAGPAVYTLGYQGTSVDRFLQTLIDRGIERVLDVRRNPVSRVYGFASRRLASLCDHIGVDYMHVPEVGIPSADRRELTDLASYQGLFDIYEKAILAGQARSLDRIASLMKEKASVLICYEADACWCHRGRLATHISQRTGLPIQHLEV